MTQAVSELGVSCLADPALAALVDELTDRLQAGEAVDLEAFIGRHPEHAGPLRQLVPALEMMGELKRLARYAASPVPSGRDPRLEAGVLGDFRIIGEIGRGGMGVVYEAQQLSLDRRVALKVLPLAAAMDCKQLQRFQLEAHAAACLHHTNIVQVHAVGCERGVPFYAMQYIEGRSLSQLIAELRRLGGLDQEGLSTGRLADISASTLGANLVSGRMAGAGARPADHSPASTAEPGIKASGPCGETASGSPTRSREYIRTVAQFGVQVAEALDHAHTRGILHRDIKPANLLLDGQGRLWVTDFGLAQIQGSPCLTLTGDILGTLRYMSPEQALAKRVVIDGRTDLYSLGVTLYELLTLRPAIDGQDRQEILRRIAQEEPVPPRRLNPGVPRDLETILLKAVAKEPSGRYATAKDLADELQRFLEDRPIRARRPSLGDRAAKLSRRHRAVVFFVAVSTFLFLILTVAVLFASNFQLRAEEKRTAEQRERAEANSRKAREVVDRMFTRVAQDLEHTPRMEKIRRALLEDALEFYQGFLKERSLDPVVRHETARAYMRVANIQVVLGRFSQAVEPLERATALLEQITAEFPGVADYWRDLAMSHRETAYVCSRVNEHERSLLEDRAELRIREKLAADFPAVPDYRRELARKYTEDGLHLEQTNANGAEGLHRKALAIWEQVRKDSPESPGDWSGEANSHHWLGSFLTCAGRLPEAEQVFRKALALAKRSFAADPENDDFRYQLGHIQDFFGRAMLMEGRHEEAESLFRRSIKLNQSLMEDFPDSPEFHRKLGLLHGNLSDSLRAMRRLPEAESCARRAIELWKKPDTSQPDPDETVLGNLYEKLGVLCHESGRVHDATDAFRHAQASYERASAANPDVFWLLFQYARFLTNCPATQFRNWERAAVLAKHGLQWAPQSRWGWRILGEAGYRSGHWQAAIEALVNATKFSSKDDPALVLFLAMAHWQVGHKREARRLYDEAVGWIDRQKSRDEELGRLRAEAASVLGLPKPTAPARKEVPHPPKG
jgi:serine/threonine protein kinase/Flp pilus assembly protein TadD